MIQKETLREEIQNMMNSRRDAINNCGMICSNVEYVLDDNGISSTHIVGTLDGSHHQFLVVSGEKITEYSSDEKVIIDASIKQFTYENKNTYENIQTAIYENRDLEEIEIIGEDTRSNLFKQYSI